MKKFLAGIAFLLWSNCALAQTEAPPEIKLWQKPFRYTLLPDAFVSIDTASYVQILRFQMVADALIKKQQEETKVQKERLELAEAQNENLQKQLSGCEQQKSSYEEELKLRAQENTNLRRHTNLRQWSTGIGAAVIGVAVGYIVAKWGDLCLFPKYFRLDIKNCINEVKDIFLSKHIFIVQVLQNNS